MIFDTSVFFPSAYSVIFQNGCTRQTSNYFHHPVGLFHSVLRDGGLFIYTTLFHQIMVAILTKEDKQIKQKELSIHI